MIKLFNNLITNNNNRKAIPMASTTTPNITTSKAAAAAFIATHKVGNTIGGGALYVALFLLTLISKGHTFVVDGNSATIYSKGKAVAVAGWSKGHILNSLVDMAGQPIIVKGPLMVERILAWAQTGKVVASVKPLYLTSKVARAAVAAGNLPG